MRNFFVIANKAKDNAVSVSYKIKEYLEKKGAVCTLDKTPDEDNKEGYTDISALPLDTECVIVLGGDGTLLQATHDLADADVPFLGINFGTLGFLSEAPAEEAFPALDRILSDDFTLEERMMISGEILRKGDTVDKKSALNDIVITRRGSMQILNFTIYINGLLMHRYHADGIIVATPTGSTGYSLSAGGPIINPVSRMIMLTPICSHSLHNRSILFSPEDEVMIRVEQETEAIFDGSHKVMLYPEDTIYIREALKKTKIVKLKEESFLMTLHNKLKDG